MPTRVLQKMSRDNRVEVIEQREETLVPVTSLKVNQFGIIRVSSDNLPNYVGLIVGRIWSVPGIVEIVSLTNLNVTWTFRPTDPDPFLVEILKPGTELKLVVGRPRESS
jgi:hypothetical protein